MKKRCFALLLALSLLLTGCSPLFDLYSAARGEYTRPDYSDGAISYRDFQRPYQPRVKYTAEPDIEYVRPDVDGLCSTLKSIGASATGGKAAAADIINQFDAAYDDYALFNTMGELAYLRYTRDLSDSYYEAEYTWCTDQTTRVEKAMEDCYTTMAKSSLRSALEEQYFGEDFFASYDSDGVYSDARTVALLQQEAELQAQYVALQNDPSIEWNGAVRSVSELLENAVTADLYYEVLGAYYDAYGAQAGEMLGAVLRACSQEPVVVLDTGGAVENAGADKTADRIQIANTLGALLKRLLDDGLESTVLIMGGDCLLGQMRQLDVTEIMPLCEVAPGVVLSQFTYGGRQWNLVSKSGGFGAKTLFYDLQNILERWKKELPAV